MPFDAFALAAVRQGLEPRLIGARIQRDVFPDAHSLALEAYATGTGRTVFLLSTQPESSRVQMLKTLPPRGIETSSPFGLLVRKHLRGARIRALVQPPFERVLELHLEQTDDAGQRYEVALFVEVMGRRSNLVLVSADGTILDALRRTPPSRNARRPILPHLPYAVPPRQDLPTPHEISASLLADRSRGHQGTLAGFLGANMAGLSPAAAREIAFRSTGTLNAPVDSVRWPSVESAIHAFVRPLDDERWEPCVAMDAEGVATDAAPYVLSHLEAAGNRVRRVSTIDEALALWQGGDDGSPGRRRGDALASERKALLQSISAQRGDTRRRIGALQREAERGDEAEHLRAAGEWLLANQWSLSPEQSTFDVGGKQAAIDRDRSLVEQAQEYFGRYRHAQESARRVPGLLTEAHLRLTQLEQLEVLVRHATEPAEIRALRAEAARPATGGGPQATGKKTVSRAGGRQQAASPPFRRIPLEDGWDVLIGASAAGNAHVSFKLASPTNLWLHARGVPGSHVILRGIGLEPPVDMQVRAAELAAWFSAARGSTRAEVDCTYVRYVKRIPGAAAGLVRYSQETTLRVEPRGPSIGIRTTKAATQL